MKWFDPMPERTLLRMRRQHTYNNANKQWHYKKNDRAVFHFTGFKNWLDKTATTGTIQTYTPSWLHKSIIYQAGILLSWTGKNGHGTGLKVRAGVTRRPLYPCQRILIPVKSCPESTPPYLLLLRKERLLELGFSFIFILFCWKSEITFNWQQFYHQLSPIN